MDALRRLSNVTFWCFDTKIYQHMAFKRSDVNALRVVYFDNILNMIYTRMEGDEVLLNTMPTQEYKSLMQLSKAPSKKKVPKF